MPSPVLDKAYHHPSATPTPSNAPLKNIGPAHTAHHCCGQTFSTEEDFKAHFAEVHTPGGAHYVAPVDANAEPQGNLTPLQPLTSQ